MLSRLRLLGTVLYALPLLVAAGFRPQSSGAHPPIPIQATNGPFVSVSIPRTVPIDSVQLAYAIVGPFGEIYTETRPAAVSRSYRIFTTADNKKANEGKIVVFAPGCEIAKFDVLLSSGASATRAFECKSAKTTRLSGRISPPELARDKNAELVIDYEPDWVMEFFGVSDGSLVHFRVVETTPKTDGTFEADLPIFAGDNENSWPLPRASFRLRLIDKQTLNSIANDLVPESSEYRSPLRSLKISMHYPRGLNFISVP
jgi:hypothetical protein